MHPGMNPIEDPELKEAAKKCLEMIAVEQRKKERSLGNLEMQIKRTFMVVPEEVLGLKCQTFVRDFNCDLNKAFEKVLAEKALSSIPKGLINQLNTPRKMKHNGERIYKKKAPVKCQTDRPEV